MKKNTNLLQKITVILSFVTTTSCIIIGEDYDNKKLTKSSASVTSAINALGSSQDTSDLYFNFVHLGNTNDVSNLNTRLNSIDTELATKATSTQVTTLGTSSLATASALLALGSSTDTSSLNLLPIIVQTGIIELAANNPALLTTYAGSTSGGTSPATVNTSLGLVASYTDTLINNLYDYIKAPTAAKITTINTTITNLQTSITSLTNALGSHISASGSVTSPFSDAKIINALNRLSYSVTAIQQVPLNL